MLFVTSYTSVCMVVLLIPQHFIFVVWQNCSSCYGPGNTGNNHTSCWPKCDYCMHDYPWTCHEGMSCCMSKVCKISLGFLHFVIGSLWGAYISVYCLKDKWVRKQTTNLFPWYSHSSDLAVWNPGLCYGGRWKSDTQFSWPDGGQSGRELGSCDLQGWRSFFLSAFSHV